MSDIVDLYRDHRGWLMAWLQQRLDCREDATDLVQDTFVRLIGKPDAGAIRQPRAYLRKIAHALLVDLVRHRDIERAYLDILCELGVPVMPSEEDRAIVVETIVRIEATLDALPARARAVFLMSRLEGLGHRDIARRLGVSL
ncbi:MAG: sigma-70 family RNA polymerase sigma factor, partial [Pseudomonadota bacterium]